MKQLEIVDPFNGQGPAGGSKEYIKDVGMTTCCGTLFDIKNIKSCVNVNNENYYCSFCKH